MGDDSEWTVQRKLAWEAAEQQKRVDAEKERQLKANGKKWALEALDKDVDPKDVPKIVEIAAEDTAKKVAQPGRIFPADTRDAVDNAIDKLQKLKAQKLAQNIAPAKAAAEPPSAPNNPTAGAWNLSWTLGSNAVQGGGSPIPVHVGQPDWAPTRPSPAREFLDNAFYAAGQEVGGPTIIPPPFGGSSLSPVTPPGGTPSQQPAAPPWGGPAPQQPTGKGPKPPDGTPTPSAAAPAAPPAPHSQSPLNPRPAPNDRPLTPNEIARSANDPALRARYNDDYQNRSRDIVEAVRADNLVKGNSAARPGAPAETGLMRDFVTPEIKRKAEEEQRERANEAKQGFGRSGGRSR